MDELEVHPEFKKNVKFIGFREYNSLFPWYGSG